jgi:hypothetical protein
LLEFIRSSGVRTSTGLTTPLPTDKLIVSEVHVESNIKTGKIRITALNENIVILFTITDDQYIPINPTPVN